MRNTIAMFIGAGALALASHAIADNGDAMRSDPGLYDYSWGEPRMRSGIGIGVTLGGGIGSFTDSAMRDVTSDVAGLWSLRVSLGTHLPAGLDINYIGTAADLQTLTGTDNGTLVGTTVETALRFNILPHYEWNPYVFAGIGWQRYDVMNANFAQSDTGLLEEDDLVEFPMGAGVSYRARSGFVADLRGTFRATDDSALLVEQSGDAAKLHWWEASAALGYEF